MEAGDNLLRLAVENFINANGSSELYLGLDQCPKPTVLDQRQFILHPEFTGIFTKNPLQEGLEPAVYKTSTSDRS